MAGTTQQPELTAEEAVRIAEEVGGLREKAQKLEDRLEQQDEGVVKALEGTDVFIHPEAIAKDLRNAIKAIGDLKVEKKLDRETTAKRNYGRVRRNWRGSIDYVDTKAEYRFQDGEIFDKGRRTPYNVESTLKCLADDREEIAWQIKDSEVRAKFMEFAEYIEGELPRLLEGVNRRWENNRRNDDVKFVLPAQKTIKKLGGGYGDFRVEEWKVNEVSLRYNPDLRIGVRDDAEWRNDWRTIMPYAYVTAQIKDEINRVIAIRKEMGERFRRQERDFSKKVNELFNKWMVLAAL